MFEIHNNDELRTTYSWVRAYQSAGVENDKYYSGFVKLLKRNIRQYVSKPASDRRIVKDYGIDGAIILYPLPIEIQTVEEANTFFRCEEYMGRPRSGFDCTGRPFTSWYKIFRRRDRYWVYHGVALDI